MMSNAQPPSARRLARYCGFNSQSPLARWQALLSAIGYRLFLSPTAKGAYRIKCSIFISPTASSPIGYRLSAIPLPGVQLSYRLSAIGYSSARRHAAHTGFIAHSPSGALEVSAAVPDPETRNAGRCTAAPTRERGIPGVSGLIRAVFLEAPAFLLSFWASGRPNSPFSPCGRRGLGG